MDSLKLPPRNRSGTHQTACASSSRNSGLTPVVILHGGAGTGEEGPWTGRLAEFRWQTFLLLAGFSALPVLGSWTC